MPLSPLESRLRYEFRNAELLRQALTHRSHSATHNERLEFLGDSVLNCAVAALLFQRFGKLDEGDLSRVRANLVKQQSLYEIAQALNISEGLRLGEGELRSGGFRRPSILADTLEAVLGAVFLDGGFEAAQTVIKRLYVPILDHIDPRTLGKDAKTLLQEYLQGHKIALPTYTVVATHGAAHNQQFEVECTVPKLDVKVSGSGASRRAAEQAAAKKALDEVLAAAPAVVGKSKRSKGARAAKKAEFEIVPGVTGVQTALDLRSPDRKNERGVVRGETRAASSTELAVERGGLAVAVAPLAVIRAAHVEYSVPERVERADKGERLEKADKADKFEKADKTAAQPGDKSTEKTAGDRLDAKPAELKPAEPKAANGGAAESKLAEPKATESKAAESRPAEFKPAELKPAEPKAAESKAAESATVRGIDKPHRGRDAAAAAASPATNAAASTEHEPGVADAVPTRVADAGH
ncbi:ribonuclease III [Paraburkholderia dilworthii]|uniref:ribonuclease III n=1 Tax=Paraburkholderia dilworthii TaxID=948106 RepID=UPI0004838A47|nr:ribonuclease III [Paraburkholderia dilworthii]